MERLEMNLCLLSQRIAAVVCALLFTVGGAIAQQAPESSDLIPVRSMESIEKEVAVFQTQKAAADARKSLVESKHAMLTSKLEKLESEIEVAEKSQELAEAQGNEGEVVKAMKEIEAKRTELEMLEAQQSLLEAESELSMAETDFIAAALQALSREATLVEKRAERDEAAKSVEKKEALPQLERGVFEAEGEVLQAFRARAELRAEFAQREAEVVARQLELHDLFGMKTGIAP